MPLRQLPAQNFISRVRYVGFSLLLMWGLALVDFTTAQPLNTASVLIHVDQAGKLDVYVVAQDQIQLREGCVGLVVWREGRNENWTTIKGGETWQKPPRRFGSDRQLASGSRSTNPIASVSTVRQTIQLDQLLGRPAFKGKTLMTPHQGYDLDGKITIRRFAQEEGIPYPAVTVKLMEGTKELFTLNVPAGHPKLELAAVSKFHDRFPDGLPSGEYQLRTETGSSVLFTVEDRDWRDEVQHSRRRLTRVLDDNDPLSIQVTVENLLNQQDEDGKPLVYLSDALDLIESVPPNRLTAHLRLLQQNILRRLDPNTEADSPPSPEDAMTTGIPEIDEVRLLIASCQWKVAREAATTLTLSTDHRTRGLAYLYLGVVESESGLASEQIVARTFGEALNALGEADSEDRFLVHHNYASILLGQCQDRLHNQSFQAATGAETPTLNTLERWYHAHRNLSLSTELAKNLGNQQQTVAHINSANAHVLLSDIVRTLSDDEVGQTLVTAADTQTAKDAAMALEQALSSKSHDLIAQSHQLLAHLAYRAGESTASEHVTQARAAFLQTGSLAGVEGIERLLGMLAKRNGNTEAAIQHLLTSSALAETLRERITSDQLGMSHMGFFARRAYINELIVELYVNQGEVTKALEFAEQAKARSLNDFLHYSHADHERIEAVDSATLDNAQMTNDSLQEQLAAWPSTHQSLVYFVGSTKSWVFLIDTSGQVSVTQISNDSRQLVKSVSTTLRGFESQATKMRRRLLSGKGFDHHWQDALRSLRSQLIPDAMLAELDDEATLLIVPHHVLNYFPFGALVTQRDDRELNGGMMARPEFLVERLRVITTSPSLSIWNHYRHSESPGIKSAHAVGIVDFPEAPRLPGVEVDMANLREAFGENVSTMLLGDDADEPAISAILSQPGMTLFATHGVNDSDDPLKSFLMAMPGRGNDGRVTAEELFGSDVKSHLIVMSACYSGLAERSPLPGDDLFGLQRAFLHAGARTVVSGLWDVYDGTGPDLMDKFFDNLADGKPVAEALCDSQRRFVSEHRKKPDDPWVHPYFWSVYSVVGDERIGFHTDEHP